VVHAKAAISTIGIGNIPLGLAYDSGRGEVFVANNGNNGSISVVSDTTNNLVANISLGPSALPHGLAYDSGKGEVFVTTQYGATQKIYVISDTNNSVAGTIPWPSPSVADIVYDSAKGELFAANPGSAVLQSPGGPLIVESTSSIFVISDATNAIVANISLGHVPANLEYNSNPIDRFIPIDMVYDSGRGEIFVTNDVYNFTSGEEVASTVSVISDATNSVVADVNLGGGTHPEGLAYDSAKGEVFVANSNGTHVAVISDKTNSIMANVKIENESTNYEAGTGLLGVAYDSANGEVLTANKGDYLPNKVSVISDASNMVTAVVNVGYGPSAVVYDAGRDEILVANSGDNTISVISGASPAPEFPSNTLPLILAITVGLSIGTYAHARHRVDT
jgi:DNA-binding beta-propeller fold protein YncE